MHNATHDDSTYENLYKNSIHNCGWLFFAALIHCSGSKSLSAKRLSAKRLVGETSMGQFLRHNMPYE